MSLIVIRAEAQRPDFQRKLLGVSLLGRIVNELAMLGVKNVLIESDVDPDLLDGILGKEALESISYTFQESTPLSEQEEVLYLPANLLISREFLKRVLEEKTTYETVHFYQASAPNDPLIQVFKTHPNSPKRTQRRQVFVEEGYCDRIDNRQKTKAARGFLKKRLLKPIEVDGFVCFWVIRPVSLRISSWLARTGILPNHVTIFTMLVGLLGCFLVALGNPATAIVGAFLYFSGCFFDCVDGELARLKYKMSYFGAWLDTLSDDIQTFFFAGALGFYLLRVEGSLEYFHLALLTMLVYALAQAYVYFKLHTVCHSGDLLDFRFAWEKEKTSARKSSPYDIFKYLLKRDFFTALFFVLFLVGKPQIALVLLATSCLVLGGAVLFDLILSTRKKTANV
jgi:hypothetical protein